MSEVCIRLSVANDSVNIRNLVSKCFGSVDADKAIENVQGRYVVAVLGGRIVAITGLKFSKEYVGYELDYTCTEPEYQNNGIMHKLFSRLMFITDEKIYCSNLRIRGVKHTFMDSLLRDFGFKLALKDRVKYSSNLNCKKSCKVNGCKFSQFGDSCYCAEDLYIREDRSNV